jgi:hypothetical protein
VPNKMKRESQTITVKTKKKNVEDSVLFNAHKSKEKKFFFLLVITPYTVQMGYLECVCVSAK